MRKTFENHWLALGLIFIGLIIAKSLLINLFPSPWIFSDEQSYFGMAQKIILGNFAGITNSHAPGYSLIISPALMLPTVAQAHAAAMLINIVITSGAVFLAYAVFRKTFNVGKLESLIYSTIVAILPQFILFNYVVMSEAVAITLIYAIFVIMLLLSDERFKSKIWMWLVLGVCVGFAPMVRTQYVVLLMMFAVYCIIKLLRSEVVRDRRGLMVSFVSAVLTYVVFRFLLFPSIGSYSEMRGSYVDGLFKAVSSPERFFDLVHIFAGELSFYFVATLFLPTFLAILILFEKLRDYKYRDLFIFWVVFIIINTAIVTLHANAVMNNLGIKTIYARYLDPIIPIIFTLGLVGVHRYKELVAARAPGRLYLVVAIGVGATALVFFAKNNIFANTFTIYVYQYVGEFLSMAIFALLAMVFLFALVRGNRKIVAAGIGLCLMVSVVPAIYKQHEFSRDTYNFYSPLGRWFDDNRVGGAVIRIDRNVTGFQELKRDAAYHERDKMDYVSFYSTLFWVNLLTNKLGVGEIKLNENVYFISDRLLPRKILAISGPFTLYDKKINSNFELDSSMLGRFGKGLALPDVDWVWMDGGGRYFLDMRDAVMPTAHRVDVEIHLRGFYPATLDKNIEVVLNGESLGIKTGRDNVYRFTMRKAKPFLVTEMEINAKTWDPNTHGYAQQGEGLGLDLKKVRVEFL